MLMHIHTHIDILALICICLIALREVPMALWLTILDCNIIVSEFEMQSCYYIHFLTNILGKGMRPLISLSYELNSNIAILLQGWIWD